MTIVREYVTILSVILSAVQRGRTQVTNLRAITNYPAIEEHYYSLLMNDVGRAPPSEQSSSEPTDDEIIKKKLCKKIFTSSYYERKQRKLIDVDDPNARRHFSQKGPSLFKYLLRPGPTGTFDRYTNPYRPYSFIYDGGYRTDSMFICPVLKKKSGEVKPYFVTREYNVNLVPNGSPIVGRFIFKIGRTMDMVVEALAEEPAVGSVVKQKFRFVAEYKYMKRRQFDLYRGAPPEVDPVCRLTPSNKLRLCASIFASKIMRFKYKFIVSEENLQPKNCINVRISFLAKVHTRMVSKIKWTFIDKKRVYEEKMIGCRVVRIGSKNPVTYYVSRGHAKNTVFIFKEKYSDGRIFVKHYLRNVSVVDGLGAEEIGQQTIT